MPKMSQPSAPASLQIGPGVHVLVPRPGVVLLVWQPNPDPASRRLWHRLFLHPILLAARRQIPPGRQ